MANLFHFSTMTKASSYRHLTYNVATLSAYPTRPEDGDSASGSSTSCEERTTWLMTGLARVGNSSLRKRQWNPQQNPPNRHQMANPTVLARARRIVSRHLSRGRTDAPDKYVAVLTDYGMKEHVEQARSTSRGFDNMYINAQMCTSKLTRVTQKQGLLDVSARALQEALLA